MVKALRSPLQEAVDLVGLAARSTFERCMLYEMRHARIGSIFMTGTCPNNDATIDHLRIGWLINDAQATGESRFIVIGAACL